MAFGSGKKPANQGSMAKANYDAPHVSKTPSPAKPGASKIMFSVQPGGTSGSGGTGSK
jgi:hypothetical protein